MIYFDNAATTKVIKEALETANYYFTEKYFNPSALYHGGLEVKNDLNGARRTLLNGLGAEGKIYFTSGGTEADNLAFFGTKKRKNSTIIISAGEHAAVYQSALSLKNQGFEVKFAPVDGSGKVIEEQFEKLLDDKVSLVSIMHVSNESGAVNDINKLAETTKRICPGALFHSDGVQAGGKIPVRLGRFIDLYSLSAHKIGAPKGTGALYVAKGIYLTPVVVGGGQEEGVRSSTENTPGIMAYAKAFALANAALRENLKKVKEIRDYLFDKISEFDDIKMISDKTCSPYILCFASGSLRGEVLQHALERKDIIVGTGSACSSNKATRRVPEALGLSGKYIDGVVRLSFSAFSTMEEARSFIETFTEIYKELKKYVG